MPAIAINHTQSYMELEAQSGLEGKKKIIEKREDFLQKNKTKTNKQKKAKQQQQQNEHWHDKPSSLVFDVEFRTYFKLIKLDFKFQCLFFY